MEKEIIVRKNPVLIFITKFLQVMFIGITFVVVGASGISFQLAKIINLVVLAIAFWYAFRHVADNNTIMRFYNNFCVIGKYKKKCFDVKTIIENKNISSIEISELPKEILIKLDSGKKVLFWKRGILSKMYNEQFYKIVESIHTSFPEKSMTEDNKVIIEQLSNPEFWNEIREEDIIQKRKTIIWIVFAFFMTALQLILSVILIILSYNDTLLYFLNHTWINGGG